MERPLSKTEARRIVRFYEDRLEEFGDDVKTVGWRSREDQVLRFEMLCRGANLRHRRILDVGCGLGDLVAFLDERTDGDFDYTGIDLSERLVAQAEHKYGGDRRRFFPADVMERDDLGMFDLVFLSGTLSFRTANNIGVAKTMMKRMFGLCREVVAVNFLSTFVDYQLEKNFHYDPAEMFAYAKSLTPWVALYHDYPLWEFTLQMRCHSF